MNKIQYKFLWHIIAVSFVFLFLQYIANYLDYKATADVLNSTNSRVVEASLWKQLSGQFYIFQYFIVFIFIGLEIKNLKAGLISFLIFVVLWGILIFVKLPSSWFSLLKYIPVLAALFVFSEIVKFNLKQRLGFTLGIALMFFGISKFTSAIFNHFDNTLLGEVWQDLTNSHYLLRAGGDYMFYSLDYLLELLFTIPLLYIYGTMFFQFISKMNSIRDFNLIQTGEFQLSKLKAIVIYFYSHFGIFLVSLGITFSIAEMFILKEQVPNYLSPFVFHLYLNISIAVFSLLLLLFLFRNFTLSYFLNHQKPISWNYFFCNVPILGFVVWFFNVLIWDRPKKVEKNILSEIYNQDNTTFKFVFVSVIIAFNILRGFSLTNESFTLILLGIDLALILVFTYYRYGLRILIALKILVFCFLVYAEFDSELVTETQNYISPNYFYSIAFFFLIYPVFFLDSFKINLIKATPSETDL